MSNFVSLRLFYGCCCTECSPNLPLLPFAWIKFRKNIFMRVRGVGINGWIIFRKRITSSLRWAVSHRYVLVITHYTAHNARERLLVFCSTHAIYWLDQNVCMWLYMCLCQCMHVHLLLYVSNMFCVSIENICRSLHTVLHLYTFVQSNVEEIVVPFT